MAKPITRENITALQRKALTDIDWFETHRGRLMQHDDYEGRILNTGSVVALIRRGLVEVIDHRAWRVTPAGREILRP